jgi:hypothetical protein
VKIIKTWLFDETPLFYVRTKKQLSYVLRTPVRQLKKLQDDDYYIESIQKIGSKFRYIQNPRPHLKNVQKRILKCLVMIPPPDWLYSSYKQRSYYNNACNHVITSNYVLTMDVENFFTSCKQRYVFDFFRNSLCTSGDVAWLLSKITTYKGYLPTGAPSSQILAFWAYWSIFFEINELAESHDCKMSLFVDDMTFSSEKPFSKQFSKKVTRILNKAGLNAKQEKTRYFGPGKSKIITGVSIPRGKKETRIPNSFRLKIIQTLREWENTPNNKNHKITQRAFGMISAARQIEPDFMEETLKKIKPWLTRNGKL